MSQRIVYLKSRPENNPSDLNGHSSALFKSSSGTHYIHQWDPEHQSWAINNLPRSEFGKSFTFVKHLQ